MPTTTSEDGGGDKPGSLQGAIDLLRAGLRPDGSYEGVGEGEVAGYQWRSLESWAVEQGLILPDNVFPEREGGREHDVLFREDDARWIKFTKPWGAGYYVEVIGNRLLMLPATPLQYLERWKVHNSVFADDVNFLGIKRSSHGSHLVISQHHVPGEDATWDEIEKSFAVGAKMQRLPIHGTLGGYESRAYFRGRIAIFDVRPQNCVYSSETQNVAAIDVIPRFLSFRDSVILRDMASGQGRMF